MQINKIQNNINFKAGLTSQIRNEIKSTDVQKVASYFQKSGIVTDFKDNKYIAWCALKSFEIIKFLYEHYKLNLGIPRGIIVDDFRDLSGIDERSEAFCTVLPMDLYDNKKYIVPVNTIYFNEHAEHNYKGGNYYWEKIDELSDYLFDKKKFPTDSFMHVFLHEFSHVIHNNNLIKLLGGEGHVDLFISAKDSEFLEKFHAKYGEMFEKLCPHATSNPYEAVACDLGTRIIDKLDDKSLLPQSNPLMNTPYVKKLLLIIENNYDKTLRRFFNGDFK